MKRNVHNILRLYDSSNADELKAGLAWYDDAHSETRNLHDDTRIAAGVVAVLSPGLRWEVNIQAAQRLIDRESLKGLGRIWKANQRKARLIIRGDNPDAVLGGNKVRAFYQCILNPNNALHVCIDGHAYAIWAGRRIPLADTPNINDRLYNVIRGDYFEAARTLSIRPCQLQAVTWTVYRRIHDLAL